MGWYYFTPSRPLEAKGGIKAQSKRGAFGSSWWAKRWIEVLESFNIGARLGRGRSYARKGQVLSIKIGEGTILAEVQGSRSKPYEVKIKIKTLTKAKWKKLAASLSKQAIFAAKLLSGQMPDDIESLFKDNGLSLFPEKKRDLKTDCSCPDWSNPCKHIAAVYYLLGEAFDRDPFLIFKIRGIEQEELVNLIADKSDQTTLSRAEALQEKVLEPEPLPVDGKIFWSKCDWSDDLFGEVYIPPVSAILPKELGSLPFWQGRDNFLDSMEEIYRNASPTGMNIFLNEQSDQE